MARQHEWVRRCILVLASAWASTTFALPMPPAARQEVLAILNKLEVSGCQFNRNGTWYAGPDAKAHLTRKLTYFEDKAALQTAEQFIEQAATASSTTGQPYQVRCGNATSPSQTWLVQQLKALRSATLGAKPAS